MKSKTVLSSILGAFLSLFVFAAFAVDIPQDSMGAQKYDRQQCVDNAAQACINSSCLNSSEIDCQANCRTMSQQKCRQELNE